MGPLDGIVAAIIALTYAVMRAGTPPDRRSLRVAYSVGVFAFVIFAIWAVQHPQGRP